MTDDFSLSQRDTAELSESTKSLLNKIRRDSDKMKGSDYDAVVSALAREYLQNNQTSNLSADNSASKEKEIAEARDEIREWIHGNSRGK